jgi:hypothetical protein
VAGAKKVFITPKGYRATIDGMADEVIRLMEKAVKGDVDLDVESGIEINGDFEMDDAGNLAISGTVQTMGPIGSVPATAEVGAGYGSNWTSGGNGAVSIYFRVVAKRRGNKSVA